FTRIDQRQVPVRARIDFRRGRGPVDAGEALLQQGHESTVEAGAQALELFQRLNRFVLGLAAAGLLRDPEQLVFQVIQRVAQQRFQQAAAFRDLLRQHVPRARREVAAVGKCRHVRLLVHQGLLTPCQVTRVASTAVARQGAHRGAMVVPWSRCAPLYGGRRGATLRAGVLCPHGCVIARRSIDIHLPPADKQPTARSRGMALTGPDSPMGPMQAPCQRRPPNRGDSMQAAAKAPWTSPQNYSLPVRTRTETWPPSTSTSTCMERQHTWQSSM